MRAFIATLTIGLWVTVLPLSAIVPTDAVGQASVFAQDATAECEIVGFFGLPPWYKYLGEAGRLDADCSITDGFELGDIWLIAVAILEMLTRIAGFLAVIFIIVGGIRMATSSGDPDRVKQARSTMINAGIGLGIAILATATIAFIAGRFGAAG